MESNQYARRKFLSTISEDTVGAMVLDPFSTTLAEARKICV